MADSGLVFDASIAVTKPLVLVAQVYSLMSQECERRKLCDAFSRLPNFALVEKAKENLNLLLVILGFSLVLHGAQFTNIFLCTGVIVKLGERRGWEACKTLYNDIATCKEKIAADAPAPAENDVADSKGKHSKKNREAKAAEKQTAEAAAKEKENLEKATKVLKFLNTEHVSKAVMEVLLALILCFQMIHGGFARSVVVSMALVELVSECVEGFVEFPDFEGIETWAKFIIRVAMWLLILPISTIFPNLTLILCTAAVGGRFIEQYGFQILDRMGKGAYLEGQNCLIVQATLLSFGSFWQLWTLAGGSGLFWVFSLLYLPLLIVESLLGTF